MRGACAKWVLLFFVMGLVACGLPRPPLSELEQIDPTLYRGSPAGAAYPAVGMLVVTAGFGGLSGSVGLCGATLVGDGLILTAAHCVEPQGQHGFVLGNQTIPVVALRQHPMYQSLARIPEHDIALGRLATPVLVNQAMPVASWRVVPFLPLTLAGFGISDNRYSASSGFHSGGVKQIGSARVGGVGHTRFEIPPNPSLSNTCLGDSGGPSFAFYDGVEWLVGVHSFAASATPICGSVANYDTHVASYYDWLVQTAFELGDQLARPTRTNAYGPGVGQPPLMPQNNAYPAAGPGHAPPISSSVTRDASADSPQDNRAAVDPPPQQDNPEPSGSKPSDSSPPNSAQANTNDTTPETLGKPLQHDPPLPTLPRISLNADPPGAAAIERDAVPAACSTTHPRPFGCPVLWLGLVILWLKSNFYAKQAPHR